MTFSALLAGQSGMGQGGPSMLSFPERVWVMCAGHVGSCAHVHTWFSFIFTEIGITLSLREFSTLIHSVGQFVLLLRTCTSQTLMNVYSFCHFPPVLSTVHALLDHLLVCAKNVFCVVHFVSVRLNTHSQLKFVDFFFRISEQTG